jgi:hypothetical protein
VTEKPFRTAGARRNSKDKTKTQNLLHVFLRVQGKDALRARHRHAFFHYNFQIAIAESDPKVRRANLDELRARAEDPASYKEFLMRTSLIESVRKAELIS